MKIDRSLILALLLCLGTISTVCVSFPTIVQSCDVPKDTPPKK